MKILLDPGHGGSQPGAVYAGVKEKDVNLAVALRCGKVLRDLGHDALFTRDADETLSLSDRLRMIDQYHAEVFVAIHCNASSTGEQAHGCETYYRDTHDYPLANSIQTVLAAYTGMKDRGVLQDEKELKKRLTVLNDLDVPSALVELGYLSNPSEEKYIIDDINTLGEVLAHGIDDYAHKKAGTVKENWPA